MGLSLTLKYDDVVYLDTKDGTVEIRMGVAGTDRTILRIDAPKSVVIRRAGWYVKKGRKSDE